MKRFLKEELHNFVDLRPHGLGPHCLCEKKSAWQLRKGKRGEECTSRVEHAADSISSTPLPPLSHPSSPPPSLSSVGQTLVFTLVKVVCMDVIEAYGECGECVRQCTGLEYYLHRSTPDVAMQHDVCRSHINHPSLSVTPSPSIPLSFPRSFPSSLPPSFFSSFSFGVDFPRNSV